MNQLLPRKKMGAFVLLKVSSGYFQFQLQHETGLKAVPLSLTINKRIKPDKLKISDFLHPSKDRIHKADATLILERQEQPERGST